MSLILVQCENYLFKKSYVAVISAYFESKLPILRTSKLTTIQNIPIIMCYQTVRLVSTFGSGSCVSSFGSKKSKGFCSFPLRLIIGGFFIDLKLCFDSLSCKQSYKKTYEAQS